MLHFNKYILILSVCPFYIVLLSIVNKGVLAISIYIMGLKQVFILNLRRIRNSKGLSQLKFAEFCDTSPNYIAEIEIGRRFPSLKLIEKMGNVLNIEPYRFFIDENEEHKNEIEKMINLVSKLPDEQRIKIINRITTQS